ncbi:MAG: hypothetical protein C4536_09955 [Actinobacteria bacterium]|jgi:hypothetical protein|nr:MAG: hypothetical protein C4536_09955 [Actinomycetota bacterium]
MKAAKMFFEGRRLGVIKMTGCKNNIIRERRGDPEAAPHAGVSGSENGFAMVFVIFAIMVVGILGALVLLYTGYVLRNAVGVTPSARAQTVAEAGLEAAHAQLASEEITGADTIDGSMWEGQGTFHVDVREADLGDGDPYDWLITSEGTYTAEVEGVERTFYRTLQEVISFAGGHYYSALDYVLFSKEGDIDIDLDGDLGFLAEFDNVSIGEPGTMSNIYAGQDITLANSAKIGIAGGAFEIYGNIYTERGDVMARSVSVALAGSDININGDIYTGIMNAGGIGGGVNFETSVGIIGGNSVNVTGNINAHGRLKDYPYGVRLDNFVAFIGGSTTHISGTIKSNETVFGQNRVGAVVNATIDIDGNVLCGDDVEFRNEMLIGATMRNDINGSVYAAGDVTLYSNSGALGSNTSRVAGDIQAGGDVDVYTNFIIGTGGGGYSIGRNIYGRNVTLTSSLGAAGTLNNTVGGSVYCRGGNFTLDNYGGPGATCTATVSGSVYASGNATLTSRANGLWPVRGIARAYVQGGGSVLNPPNLAGAFAGGNMTLTAQETVHFIVNDEAVMSVSPNSRRSVGSPTISEINGGDVQQGTTAPAVGAFTPLAANPPEAPTPFGEVLLPACDFDYYRELAKEQEAIDGLPHYFSGDTNLNMTEADFAASSTHVVFADGNLTIDTVAMPLDTKGVFVSTGNITLSDTLRTDPLSSQSEFQLIAKNKVAYVDGFNAQWNDGDNMFIYAAHENYDPNNPNESVSVEYEMGWLRDVTGQITARGDIVLTSHPWAFLFGSDHSIKYKSPTVLGEAFRIPFTVKSWKEL